MILYSDPLFLYRALIINQSAKKIVHHFILCNTEKQTIDYKLNINLCVC